MRTTIHAPMTQRGDAQALPPGARTYRSAAEAFPRHCEYACALELPPRRTRTPLADALFGVALACLVALVAFGMATGWRFGR